MRGLLGPTSTGFVAFIVAVAGVAAGEWTAEEEAKLLAADGTPGSFFGMSVALDDDTAFIGRSGFITCCDELQAAVYVFTRADGIWTQDVKLLPSDAEPFINRGFGVSVALDGNTVVIGAWLDNAPIFGSGSAYVFTRVEGVWTEQVKLTASDGDGVSDHFGVSVALDGDTAVIGTWLDDDNGADSGSAYVFTGAGDVWTQQAKLLPSDGAPADHFGRSVAIFGDTALIGAYQDDDNGVDSGSAYVFLRAEGVWAQQAKLVPADGAPSDEFGLTVALDGDTALIGAHWDDDNGADSGSAYVFTGAGESWMQQTKLLPADGAPSSQFGLRVALDGDTAVIGAYRDDDNGVDSGAAYVFTRAGDVWAPQGKLLSADGAPADEFGVTVAIDGDTTVIGAWRDDDSGPDSGSAYVFRCTSAPPGDPQSLLAARDGDDVALSWDDPGEIGVTWNVYRNSGPDPATWGPSYLQGVTDADPVAPGIQLVDTDAVAAGSPLFYLITAVNGCAESAF